MDSQITTAPTIQPHTIQPHNERAASVWSLGGRDYEEIIRGVYDGRDRWFCPHRLGRNHKGQLRALCYQYAGQSDRGLQAAGSPANWRCIAVEKLSRVELLEGAWQTAPNHSRPQTCVAEVDVDTED